MPHGAEEEFAAAAAEQENKPLHVGVQEAGSRRNHKVVLVRAASLRPLEPPEIYKQVPRRVLGNDGQIRATC